MATEYCQKQYQQAKKNVFNPIKVFFFSPEPFLCKAMKVMHVLTLFIIKKNNKAVLSVHRRINCSSFFSFNMAIEFKGAPNYTQVTQL